MIIVSPRGNSWPHAWLCVFVTKIRFVVLIEKIILQTERLKAQKLQQRNPCWCCLAWWWLWACCGVRNCFLVWFVQHVDTKIVCVWGVWVVVWYGLGLEIAKSLSKSGNSLSTSHNSDMQVPKSQARDKFWSKNVRRLRVLPDFRRLFYRIYDTFRLCFFWVGGWVFLLQQFTVFLILWHRFFWSLNFFYRILSTSICNF